MKHQHRLDMRMRTYARIELHAVGEIHNRSQARDLALLRARLAALEALESTEQTTKSSPPTTTKVDNGALPF